jgi:hypothetical protein
LAIRFFNQLGQQSGTDSQQIDLLLAAAASSSHPRFSSRPSHPSDWCEGTSPLYLCTYQRVGISQTIVNWMVPSFPRLPDAVARSCSSIQLSCVYCSFFISVHGQAHKRPAWRMMRMPPLMVVAEFHSSFPPA